MPFPTSHSFTVPVPNGGTTSPRWVLALTAALREIEASSIRPVGSTTLAFGGGGQWSQSPLQPVSDGTLAWDDPCAPGTIVVALQFGGLIGMVTLYAILAAVGLFIAVLSAVLPWPVAFVLWLAGTLLALVAGYAWAVGRGRGALRAAIRQAAHVARAA